MLLNPTTICLAAALGCMLSLPVEAETFTPKSYIKAVFAVSPVIGSAEQSFEQAGSVYRSAIMDAVAPSFSLSLSNSLYDDQNTALRLRKGDTGSSLSASWNLYDSAASPVVKVRKARLDYEYAQLTLLIAKQSEAVSALNRFYALYSAKKRIEIARMNLASRARQYKDTSEQYQSGTRSKTEQTQSEGDKLQSELSLAQAESAARKALLAFNEMLNTEPDEEQEALVSTQSVNIALPLPRDDMQKALDGNFSLRRQKVSLEKTRLNTRSNIMSDYPRFRLDASYNKSNLGLFRIPGGSWDGNPSYGLGMSLNFPFGFLGAQNYLDVKAQSNILKSAELGLVDALRSLKTSVLTAQEDIALQVKSLKLLEFQIKAQKGTTDMLLEEYSQGNARFLELDTAQTKLLDSSGNQITAVNDMDIALANYRTLLGEKIWE